MQEKYRDNPAYEILKIKQSGDYTAYLGKDNERLSLDIFYKNEYFGGMPMTFEKRNVLNSIDIYNSSHYDALTVIFGENPDLMYKNYHMEIGSSPISVGRNLRGITEVVETPKRVTRDIEGEQYVLDIYVLDLMYDGFPDLTFTKVNEN